MCCMACPMHYIYHYQSPSCVHGGLQEVRMGASPGLNSQRSCRVLAAEICTCLVSQVEGLDATLFVMSSEDTMAERRFKLKDMSMNMRYS